MAQAQQIALQNSTPIFIYFTKTYCPHCVPIEQNVLPSPGLKPAYGQVAWLFNTRNFQGDPADRVAEQIEQRFGITSYPHLLLVDPEKLTILKNLGRTEASLLSGFSQTPVRVTNARQAVERLRAAEQRVAGLRKAGTPAAAKKALTDEDIVVQLVALDILSTRDPKSVATNAQMLLQMPHDPFRYQVCETLAKVADKSAAPALEELLDSPANSMNPNVLRIHAVDALAKCGTANSAPVVAKFATTGEYNNGLTRASLDALMGIAMREPKARAAIKSALVQAYPSVPASPAAGELERCTTLAQRVHEHLTTISGKGVPFPTAYTNATRSQLQASW